MSVLCTPLPTSLLRVVGFFNRGDSLQFFQAMNVLVLQAWGQPEFKQEQNKGEEQGAEPGQAHTCHSFASANSAFHCPGDRRKKLSEAGVEILDLTSVMKVCLASYPADPCLPYPQHRARLHFSASLKLGRATGLVLVTRMRIEVMSTT